MNPNATSFVPAGAGAGASTRPVVSKWWADTKHRCQTADLALSQQAKMWQVTSDDMWARRTELQQVRERLIDLEASGECTAQLEARRDQLVLELELGLDVPAVLGWYDETDLGYHWTNKNGPPPGLDGGAKTRLVDEKTMKPLMPEDAEEVERRREGMMESKLRLKWVGVTGEVVEKPPIGPPLHGCSITDDTFLNGSWVSKSSSTSISNGPSPLDIVWGRY